MACDELVITRLGVEQQAYGEMLINVLRQINLTFRGGLLAVGMSGSYQTISRRIKAMKSIHSFTRKQLALAASAMMLLAAVTMVPWQLVARKADAAPPETKSATTADDKNAPNEDNSPAAGGAGGKSSPEQLLVGVWRGTTGYLPQDGDSHHELTLIFRQDGTCQMYDRSQPGGVLTVTPVGAVLALESVSRGRWKIEGENLIVIPSPEKTPWLKGISPPPPPIDEAKQDEVKRVFRIARLDDALLRLALLDASQSRPADANNADNPLNPATGEVISPNAQPRTLFFRRDKDTPANVQYSPDIPAGVRVLAEQANLTPREALELASYFDSVHKKLTSGMVDLSVVQRIVDARREKIDFAQLFELTPDEVTAYRELMKLTGNRYSTASSLSSSGQLTATEESAVQKLEKVSTELNRIVVVLNHDLKANSVQIDPSNWFNSNFGPSIDEEVSQNRAGTRQPQFDLLRKAAAAVNDLQQYLNSTVYSN